MTTGQAIKFLEKDKIQRGECLISDALDVAIDTINKYQTMQGILEKIWNIPASLLDEAECLNEIMETYRTVRHRK